MRVCIRACACVCATLTLKSYHLKSDHVAVILHLPEAKQNTEILITVIYSQQHKFDHSIRVYQSLYSVLQPLSEFPSSFNYSWREYT